MTRFSIPTAVLISTIFLFTGTVAHGQTTDTIQTTLVNKSNVTLEVGGAGLFGSVNYEHLLSYKSDKKLLLRAGLFYFPNNLYSNNRMGNLINAIGIYYLIGSKHHLELGLNNILVYDFTNKVHEFGLSFSTGYRCQKFLSKSASFSAAFSPLMLFTGNGNVEFGPWAKIGIGYSFNRRNVNLQSKPNSSDTSKTGKTFFLEFGTHFLVSKQSFVSKNRNGGNGSTYGVYSEIGFPIDTTTPYVNGLVVNRRMFPTFSAGLDLHSHEFKTEFAYARYKSLYSYAEDFGKDAYFNSKDYYLLIGYSYSIMNKKKKLNSNTRFYGGANLLLQHKDGEFHYGHWDGVGGCPCSSEDLNSNFTSDHISFIPDAGIKLNSIKKVYVKFGLRINAVSYSYGKFSWNYKTVTDGFPQITTYTEKSGSFSKLLFAGESSYFTLIDNAYFKIGLQF